MIDLHSHTTESDGTLTPLELVELAAVKSLEALGITDHDTFAGYDQARPAAEACRLELVCGIELSTKLDVDGRKSERSVHLLGYFPDAEPAAEFRSWLHAIQESRRDRNLRLVGRLRELGLDIRLEEVQQLGGSMTGRPHFAKLLRRKGYVKTLQEAFDRYLDESAPGYVERLEPGFAEAVARIREAGGVSSLAHPVRLAGRDAALEFRTIERLAGMGLRGIEAYHSDHSSEDTARYLDYARKYGLAVTGGSDFHGDTKPDVQLGAGRAANLRVSRSVLDQLRAIACQARG